MGATSEILTIAREEARPRRVGALVAETAIDRPTLPPAAKIRCRTNSRRGVTDPDQRSYAPVGSVCRALDVLRIVNKLRIASVNGIYEATGFPKPTIVRMLETLMAAGYVARDNMCGGYRVTARVHELNSGFQGIAQVIEISRPLAIDLTRKIKWPIGIGVLDGDAIALKFWTGAISPFAHTNTVLGLRPDLVTSAMGRAYLAFCPAKERGELLRALRADPARNFSEADERRLSVLLEKVRQDGYATRDPRTKPHCTVTLAMPIRVADSVHALISLSLFKSAVEKSEFAERILTPLRATTAKIEEALAFVNAGGLAGEKTPADLEPGF